MELPILALLGLIAVIPAVIWSLLIGGAGAFAIVSNARLIIWIVGILVAIFFIRKVMK